MLDQAQESNRKLTIFEIGDELDRIAIAFDQLEENPDAEPVVSEAFEAYFAQLLDDRDNKLDRYAAFVAWQQHLCDAAKAESKRTADLAKVFENRIKRSKEYLKTYLEANGITKIETGKHIFTVANNGGVAPLIIDEGVKPEEVSECFQKVTIDFNRDEIRTAIESGQDVQFARLGERGTNLRIR